jgi:hypothetical protein
MHPIERDLLTARIVDAANIVYAENPAGPKTPESIMQKITGRGAIAGCVQKGSNKGVVSLGVTKPASLDVARDVCESLATTESREGLAFGALVGSSPNTPIVSLSGKGQALYQNFYEQCKQRQTTGAAQQKVAEGQEAKKKKVADAQTKAQKAAEDAAKKQKEADAAKQKADEALKAEKDAAQKAQETYNDPNATDAEKAKAGNDVVKATNDRQAAEAEATQKQADANAAKSDAEAARQDVIEAQKDLDFDKAMGDIADTELPKLAAAALSPSPLGKGMALASFGGAVFGALSGRYGFECMEGECGSSSCEADAMTRAWEAEAQSYKSQATCNFGATPLPDQDRCYDKAGGLFDVPEVTLVDKLAYACKTIQKLSDTHCDKIMPPSIWKVLTSDPCNSPVAMCAPETSGSRQNPSTPIPNPGGGGNPTMWTSCTQPPGCGTGNSTRDFVTSRR